MSTSADTTTVQPGGTHAGQWGLAAILLGALVILLFPMFLLLIGGLLMGSYEDPFVESRDIDLAVTGSWAVFGAMAGIALFSLICAIVGLVSARERRQPLGLSIAGFVVALAAMVITGILLLGLQRAADWTRQLQQLRNEKGIRRPPPEMFR
jgi:hypothetical protein